MAAGRRKAGANRNPWFQVQQDAIRREQKKANREASMSAKDRRIEKFLKDGGY